MSQGDKEVYSWFHIQVPFVTTRLLPIANVVNNWKRLQNPFFISSQKMFKIQCKDEKHTPAKIIDWSTFLSTFGLLAKSIVLVSGCVNPSQCYSIYSICWCNLRWDLEDVSAALRLGSRWNFLARLCFFCDCYLAPSPPPDDPPSPHKKLNNETKTSSLLHSDVNPTGDRLGTLDFLLVSCLAKDCFKLWR